MKKATALLLILLHNVCAFTQGDNYLYGNFNLDGVYTYPNNGVSGYGGFNSLTTVPDYTWSITTSNNKLSSLKTVMSSDEMPQTNSWETKYGEAQYNPMLYMRHAGNAAYNGQPLGIPLQCKITFSSPTASSKWAFLMLDMDVDQVDISAIKPDGTSFSNSEITSWYRGSGNAAGGTGPYPCFASATATAVGAGHSSIPCTRKNFIETATAIDGDYIYFEPNAQVKSLPLKFYNLQQTSSSSIRLLLVAAEQAILPATLGRISAEWNDNQSIKLKWNALSETATDRYIIMHSKDGRNFQPAGSVSATGAGYYEWLHAGITEQNTLYYRLKIVDHDQSYGWSEVFKVEPKLPESSLIKVYPNPASGDLFIRGHFKTKTRLNLINAMGNIVQNAELSDGINKIPVSTLLPGVYRIQIFSGSRLHYIGNFVKL